MALQTNDELLEQLRAIGWTDGNIAKYYPDLIPEYGVSPYATPSTLYERLLMIGWSEEKIREEHPEILPASEGGILETLGEPVYTLGERAGEPIDDPEPIPRDDLGAVNWDLEPGGGVIIHPVGLPGEDYQAEVPSVASDQTTNLMVLGLIFL